MNGNGNVVSEIKSFTADIMAMATREKSVFGLGGMVSKLTFARLATRLGIKVVIFGSHGSESVVSALTGASGTICHAKPSTSDARKKWLASGSIVAGRITIDAGAGQALSGRKSLLSVGIRSIDEDFEKGEVIEVFVEGCEWPLCVARAKLSATELRDKLNAANTEVAHADDIVLL